MELPQEIRYNGFIIELHALPYECNHFRILVFEPYDTLLRCTEDRVVLRETIFFSLGCLKEDIDKRVRIRLQMAIDTIEREKGLI